MALEPRTLAGSRESDGENYDTFWSARRRGRNVGINRRRKGDSGITGYGRSGGTLARASSSATAPAATTARAAGIVSRTGRGGRSAGWRWCKICFRSRLRGWWLRRGLRRGGLGLTLRRCAVVESGLQRRGLSGRFLRRFFTPFQLLLHPFTHVGLLTYPDACGQSRQPGRETIRSRRFAFVHQGLNAKCRSRL